MLLAGSSYLFPKDVNKEEGDPKMTIYTIKDLLQSAQRLPTKYREGMTLKLEDMEEQLRIWSEKPEELSKDEGTHRGIAYLAGRLLGA